MQSTSQLQASPCTFRALKNLPLVIQSCIDGDRISQNKFYCYYHGYVWSVCNQYTLVKQDVQECVNDTFLKVLINLKNFNPPADREAQHTHNKLLCWVRAIAENTCLDYVRRYSFPSYWPTKSIDDTMHAPYYQVTPLQKMAYDELYHKAIKKLHPASRQVFDLSVIYCYTHEHIAYQLNIPLGTIKTRIAKAKQDIRNMIKGTHGNSYRTAVC